jgi:hypothetical protein
MNISTNKEIITHLTKIEDQLTLLNTKIDNFLGFEELSADELEELDNIEKQMEKGERIPLDNII